MEVHHPHHPTHKKKWTGYLLEFVMLFLAVFLGFLAENYREHIVERKNANEYLKEYRNDLLRNQEIIHRFDSMYLSLIPVYDSICNIYFTKTENSELHTLERILYVGKRHILTQISTPTYSQLLNSGNLKYIRSAALRDSMAGYYDRINQIRDYDLRMIQLKNAIYPEVMKIEDMHGFWRVDKDDPENTSLVPDMQPFELLTGEQRRLIVNYYRQFFVQMRSNHRYLKRLMEDNQFLVDMIDKE